MNGWKYKLYRFMQGRRGLDNLGKFLLISAIVLMVIAMFLGRIPVAYYITYYLGLILFIYAYFRAFSRNLYKREAENNRYLALKYRITKGRSFSQRRYDRKIYAYFKCPGCGQKMRAPKGKGNIKVKCHNCNTEFTKKV